MLTPNSSRPGAVLFQLNLREREKNEHNTYHIVKKPIFIKIKTRQSPGKKIKV